MHERREGIGGWLAGLAAALVLLLLLPAAAQQPLSARVQRLGNQMICMCGCNQKLLECDHLGCSYRGQMRQELIQRAASPDSDELVLQSFVQEYGTQVLANPTHTGFNQLAWTFPWIAGALGLILVLYLIRVWSRRGAAATAAPSPQLLERIHQEIDEELNKS